MLMLLTGAVALYASSPMKPGHVKPSLKIYARTAPSPRVNMDEGMVMGKGKNLARVDPGMVMGRGKNFDAIDPGMAGPGAKPRHSVRRMVLPHAALPKKLKPQK